jgi:hypothetical protein
MLKERKKVERKKDKKSKKDVTSVAKMTYERKKCKIRKGK